MTDTSDVPWHITPPDRRRLTTDRLAWDGWRVSITHDFYGRVHTLTITQDEPLGPDDEYHFKEITARRLRELPLRKLSEMAKAEAVERIGMDWPWEARPEFAEEWVERFSTRPGAAGRDDLEYALLAERYVALVAAGVRNPIAILAGQDNKGRATIRNSIFTARDRLLLTSVGDGRVGGELTDKSRALLEAHNHGKH